MGIRRRSWGRGGRGGRGSRGLGRLGWAWGRGGEDAEDGGGGAPGFDEVCGVVGDELEPGDSAADDGRGDLGGADVEPELDVGPDGPADEVEEGGWSAVDGAVVEGAEEVLNGVEGGVLEEAGEEGLIGRGKVGEMCGRGGHVGEDTCAAWGCKGEWGYDRGMCAQRWSWVKKVHYAGAQRDGRHTRWVSHLGRSVDFDPWKHCRTFRCFVIR